MGTPTRLGPVDLDLRPGALTVVLGRNGSGKSTLLRCIAGLDAYQGTVTIGALDLATAPLATRAAHVAWLPQHAPVEAGLTALDAVTAARFRHREPRSTAQRAALDALEALDAGDLAPRPVGTLSGGEAQRVRLAAMVAQEAHWWLLDEPANHLDPGVRLDLVATLRARVAAGGSVIWVSHDLGLLGQLAPADVVLLDAGRVVHTGPLDAPELPARLGATLGVVLQRVKLDPGWALVPVGRP